MPAGDRDPHQRLQVRTREFADDQISVYFTVRQYWGTGPDMTFRRVDPPPAGDRRGDPPAVGDSPDRSASGAGDRLALVAVVTSIA